MRGNINGAIKASAIVALLIAATSTDSNDIR